MHKGYDKLYLPSGRKSSFSYFCPAKSSPFIFLEESEEYWVEVALEVAAAAEVAHEDGSEKQRWFLLANVAL